MGRQCHRLALVPELANLIALENFISRCGFLKETERNRALLLTTELFDNIARYSVRRFFRKVSVTVRKAGESARIELRYGTANFAQMLGALGTTRPHYDTGSARYRGLGLRMCQNLAADIQYHEGLFKSLIIIIL